jgi:hypothetical protein
MNTVEQIRILTAASSNIGKRAILRGKRNDFDSDVLILDATIAYGSIRYHVSPISGQGSVWVDANRVKIQSEVI